MVDSWFVGVRKSLYLMPADDLKEKRKQIGCHVLKTISGSAEDNSRPSVGEGRCDEHSRRYLESRGEREERRQAGTTEKVTHSRKRRLWPNMSGFDTVAAFSTRSDLRGSTQLGPLLPRSRHHGQAKITMTGIRRCNLKRKHKNCDGTGRNEGIV